MDDNPNVKQAVPFLSVSNMAASLKFYIDGLGFHMTRCWVVDENIRWCWLEIGHAALMLQAVSPEEVDAQKLGSAVGLGVTIYFICNNAIQIYHEATERGLEVRRPFVGNGMWVTGMTDPDGYRIEFESSTDAAEGSQYDRS